MRRVERFLLFIAALAAGGAAYVVSSVFGLLRWPVFVLLCLVLAEIFYRVDREVCARHGK